MSDSHEALNDELIAFIRAQKMFFVGTAPRSDAGRVNISPKGYDSFAIVDSRTVLWLDLGGSGAETIAHVRENGRITLMFCAFEGKANIVRVYGEGEAIPFHAAEFDGLRSHYFPVFDRARAIIRVRVSSVAESCGWGVPFFEFKSEREQLKRWIDTKSFEDWAERRYQSNALSIDGLPALDRAAPGERK